MWKTLLSLFFVVFGLAGYWFYSEIEHDKKRIEKFRQSWSTEIVGVIDSVDLFTGDAGVIYFGIKDIRGEKHDLSTYSGSPFYLLTNGKRGKLIEGGIHSIVKGDVLMITDQKDFIILRNNKVILSWPIYFRDASALWRNTNMEQLKTFWAW